MVLKHLNEPTDEQKLALFFKTNKAAALGFSGGVDSAYLLYAGIKYGARIGAYFVKTAFQPAFELSDARRLAEPLGVRLSVIELDILSDKTIAANPHHRCYYCKKALFTALREQAAADGFMLLIDGTNASDDSDDRPGMKALTELAVRSPLRECGITKDAVRRLSRTAGLFTWDKPAYACLATRIPPGQVITPTLLARIERCEDGLLTLGFTDFRIRTDGNSARLQLTMNDLARLPQQYREVMALLQADFNDVVVDLQNIRGGNSAQRS